MSDTSQGPGWWQASDGKWYPPEQAPGATPQPAGGRLDIGAALSYGWEKFVANLSTMILIVIIFFGVQFIFSMIVQFVRPSGVISGLIVGGVIGAGELGERDDDRLAAEAVAQAVLGLLEGRLEVADFAFVAALADLELVVDAAVEAHLGRGPAGSHAVEAEGRALRVGVDRDDLDEGRVDRRGATGDGGTEDKEGNREAHGFGV